MVTHSLAAVRGLKILVPGVDRQTLIPSHVFMMFPRELGQTIRTAPRGIACLVFVAFFGSIGFRSGLVFFVISRSAGNKFERPIPG